MSVERSISGIFKHENETSGGYWEGNNEAVFEMMMMREVYKNDALLLSRYSERRDVAKVEATIISSLPVSQQQ